MKKIIVRYALVAFLVLNGCAAQIPPMLRERGVSFNGVASISFSVGTTRVRGNSFFISPNGCLVTTMHFIQQASQRKITVFPGFEDHLIIPIRLVPNSDLAFLKVEGAGQTPFFTLSDTLYIPAVGEKLFILSRPETFQAVEVGPERFAMYTARHAAEKTKGVPPIFFGYKLLGDRKAGDSGSPVFNAKGLVVGVVAAVSPKKDKTTGTMITFAIPLARSLMTELMLEKDCVMSPK